MATPESRNVDLIHEYLAALGGGESGDSLRRFFDDDAVEIELPNLLAREGQEGNVDQAVQDSLDGQKMVGEQRYEILEVVADDDNVAVEAVWTATLATGTQVKAAFAMFLHFRNGRIVRQRNYRRP